jgi:hypothetical protein
MTIMSITNYQTSEHFHTSEAKAGRPWCSVWTTARYSGSSIERNFKRNMVAHINFVKLMLQNEIGLRTEVAFCVMQPNAWTVQASQAMMLSVSNALYDFLFHGPNSYSTSIRSATHFIFFLLFSN